MSALPVTGNCHCGRVAVELSSDHAASELPLRACQCSFCRKHNARTVVDPQGQVRIRGHGPTDILRYRFGLRTADFFLCSGCGVYLGAVCRIDGADYSTINVNCFPDPGFAGRAAEPAIFDGETEAERLARRRAAWTPTIVED